MTIFGGNFGGGGFGSNERGVQDKLAALKAKKGNNPAANVEKFLSEDLGVDIREIPFNLKGAMDRLHEIVQAEVADVVELRGNSMGITAVVLSNGNYPGGTCPCGATAHGDWESTDPAKNTGEWLCYDCDETTTLPLPDTALKTATPNDHQGLDWHDVERVYTALNRYLPIVEEFASERGTYWSFKGTLDYRGMDVHPVEGKKVNPDPKSYPSGSVLRLEKHVLGEDGEANSIREYVRVGGLWSDDEITSLATMTPITDLTGWSVTEELS